VGVKPRSPKGRAQRAGLTPASGSNTLSCQWETLHPKLLRSKNPIDSDHGIYGELASGCGAGRYDRSGRAGRFGSKVGCARGREGMKGVLRDPIDAVPALLRDWLTQAEDARSPARSPRSRSGSPLPASSKGRSSGRSARAAGCLPVGSRRRTSP
jgi:hypothetical protein